MGEAGFWFGWCTAVSGGEGSRDRCLRPPPGGDEAWALVYGPGGGHRITRMVLVDAMFEPENPVLRERGCREVLLRASGGGGEIARRHGPARAVLMYYMLGAYYRPARAVRIKTYAYVCPEGVAVFAQWVSRSVGAPVLQAAGTPSIVAEEVKYVKPAFVAVPVEQCETIPKALEEAGVKVYSVSRKESVTNQGTFYVCVVNVSEELERRRRGERVTWRIRGLR